MNVKYKHYTCKELKIVAMEILSSVRADKHQSETRAEHHSRCVAQDRLDSIQRRMTYHKGQIKEWTEAITDCMSQELYGMAGSYSDRINSEVNILIKLRSKEVELKGLV